jgi:hypothetical protein
MISAEQIMALAATLGTPRGLGRVDAEMQSLRNELANRQIAPSRDELVSIARALQFLGVALRIMERIAGDSIVRLGKGTVNCVG